MMDFDMNGILDSVLDNIDDILTDIPPNPSRSPSATNSSTPASNSSYNTPFNTININPINTTSFNSSNSNNSFHSNASYNSPISPNTPTPIPALHSSSMTANKPTKIIKPIYALHTPSNLVCNNISTSISRTNVSIFEPKRGIKLQLKDHVFISKDCTPKLAAYIVKENWGKNYSLLYKYLDYIFRCQAFGRQVIQIKNEYNNKYLIFNTGLQRHTDNQILYALLIPNNIPKIQQWRVPFGHMSNSFVSKTELIDRLKSECNIEIDHKYIPKKTKFHASLSDLLYDDSYSINANWEERLTTNKDRIFKVMGSIAFFDDNKKYPKLKDLIEAFDDALPRTQRIAEMNPRLAVAQGFVDTLHHQYRMELLLPLIVKFPKNGGNLYKFALAIGKSTDINHRNEYIVKSILTMEMAYANARLVGYVDSLWLTSTNSNYKKRTNDINDFCVSTH